MIIEMFSSWGNKLYTRQKGLRIELLEVVNDIRYKKIHRNGGIMLSNAMIITYSFEYTFLQRYTWEISEDTVRFFQSWCCWPGKCTDVEVYCNQCRIM